MLILLVACAPDADDAPTYQADVAPILAHSCVACHAEGEAGGFPLGTYDEAYALRDSLADAVTDRRMPPWLAADGCNEYAGDISLSDDEIATIQAWADAGGPQGDPADAVEVEPMELPTLDRVDHTLAAPEYTPAAIEGYDDDYRCFPLALPMDEDVYVTGYDIRPENPELVHHVVLFLAGPEFADDFVAMDEADAGAGYECFGGPGVVESDDAEWLGAWAPGSVSGIFPEGSGIHVQAGSTLIFQTHYNLANVQPAIDATEIDLRIEDEVDHPATIQPWANPGWLDSDNMHIPANSEGVTHEFGYILPRGFQIHSASVHMHTLGQSARMWLEKADDAGETCLLDVPRWDFSWQRGYRLAEPVQVEPGDRLAIECTWDNPTDEDVYWGEGTGDEMCLGTMFLTE